MKLTVENIRVTMMATLPQEGELTKEQENTVVAGKNLAGYIRAEGVRGKFLFVKKKVEEKREDIRSMLSDLPDNFHKSKGGGWSFLNGCVTKDGTQWGEQRDVDDLICLGIAVGFVTFQLPREMWESLPGGVPYFVVDLEDKTGTTQEASPCEPLAPRRSPAMCKLKNGAEEMMGLVVTLMRSIRKVMRANELAIHELWVLSKDKTHKIFQGVDGDQVKILKVNSLIEFDSAGKPYVTGTVRNIILSAFVMPEDGEFSIGNPIKKEEAPA